MAGRKIREEVFGDLQHEKNMLVQENKELVFENELIQRQNIMLIDTLDSLTQDETFWSEDAIKSGVIFRLKNILNNVRNMQ
jgi:hypothetical protein